MYYSIEVTILLSLLWLVGVVSFLRSAYFLMKCFLHIHHGKEFIVKANPLSIFLESSFTTIGNSFRVKFIRFMNIGILMVVLSVVIALLSEPGNVR
jgi:hypothetical protein